MSQFSWPPVTTTTGPIQFLLDGVVTSVSEDTGTPANSTPLPVTLLGGSGNTLDTDYGVVGANTLRSAAQIGNATGAADFNAGTTGAQTLRVIANQGNPGVGAWPVLAAQSGNWDIRNITGTVSLPTGASTAAKQPALGTAGTASSDVLTVQGIASMTPLLVNGSGSTQPVSGTVTANQGTANATPWNDNVAQWGGANTTLGQKAMTASVPVAIASDQSAIPVTQSVNATGTYTEITNLTNSAQTFTSPAGAHGFILEALSDNTANVRYKIGAAATTTSGMRLEPGRDSGYLPLGANISVICETAATNQVVTVQWVGP